MIHAVPDLRLQMKASTGGEPYQIIASGTIRGGELKMSRSLRAEFEKRMIEHFDNNPPTSDGTWQISIGETTYQVAYWLN